MGTFILAIVLSLALQVADNPQTPRKDGHYQGTERGDDVRPVAPILPPHGRRAALAGFSLLVWFLCSAASVKLIVRSNYPQVGWTIGWVGCGVFGCGLALLFLTRFSWTWGWWL